MFGIMGFVDCRFDFRQSGLRFGVQMQDTGPECVINQDVNVPLKLLVLAVVKVNLQGMGDSLGDCYCRFLGLRDSSSPVATFLNVCSST
jgi:hypothetical protein